MRYEMRANFVAHTPQGMIVIGMKLGILLFLQVSKCSI